VTFAAFLAVAFLHLMAAISPGPAVLMAARTGVTEGLRTGAFLAAGIGAGAVVWARRLSSASACCFRQHRRCCGR
jgi:threonine/homoserine/homoserine lactone efflux protein